MQTPFAEIVEQVHQLDSNSKLELMCLLRAWLIEERREEIAGNVQAAQQEYAQGRARSGTVDDLMADLYAED
jgi:hypothetical protein